jgi:uncharacterized protein (DUF2267 family)
MTFHDFIGKVQNRTRLGTSGEAVRATRATMEVLGQRLFGGEAKDLAAQLPEEIGVYLTSNGESEAFGLDEFYRRVGKKEGVDLPVAVHHARSVMSVVQEACSPGELEDVRAQLPDEYDSLFEADIKGSE